jgi:hypothetical protein
MTHTRLHAMLPTVVRTYTAILVEQWNLRQWWANLDQAPKDLDKTIFRDLSPTPKP